MYTQFCSHQYSQVRHCHDRLVKGEEVSATPNRLEQQNRLTVCGIYLIIYY